MITLLVISVLYPVGVLSQYQWNFSPEQTEVYDLVDEVDEMNFYEFLNIAPDATSSQVSFDSDGF